MREPFSLKKLFFIENKNNFINKSLRRISAINKKSDGYSRFRGHIQIQTYTTGVVHNKLDIDVLGAFAFPGSLSTHMFRDSFVHGSEVAIIWVY
jgi:hypothetical protein